MNKEAAAVKLARELGIDAVHSWGKPTPGVELIERFFQAAYSAGAADEREALAKDWESRHGYDKYGVAAAIRARGQDPMPLFDDWGGIPYKSCPPCNQQCNQGRDCPNA